MPDVFLSSTSKDLEDCRKAAADAIQSLDYRCVSMKYFASDPKSPEQYVRDRVRDCDLFVGVLGCCYGSIPRGHDASFTEMEYDTARKLGKPCFMFLSSDEFLAPQKFIIDDGNWDRQRRFRERVSLEVVRGMFRTPEDLKFQVVQALKRPEPEAARRVDCVILCGGQASRLWPLTRDFCKVLLPVGGRPVLDYVLESVRECPSVRRTYLVTNREFEPQIRSYLRASGRRDARLVVEPQPRGGRRLGAIGALHHVVSRFGLRDVLLLGGDNLFRFSLDGFIRFACHKGASANAFYYFETGQDVTEYGVATLDSEGAVKDFTEKKIIPSHLNISTACYFLQESETKSLAKYLAGGGDPGSLGGFIHWLVARRVPVAGHVFRSEWFDVGTRRKLLEANGRFMSDARLGSVDKASQIKGPVQMESGSVVRQSRIGPNVYLGPGVEIIHSSISDAIVMEGARIRRGNVIGSVIGPGSTVEGGLVDAVVGRNAHILAEIAHDAPAKGTLFSPLIPKRRRVTRKS